MSDEKDKTQAQAPEVKSRSRRSAPAVASGRAGNIYELLEKRLVDQKYDEYFSSLVNDDDWGRFFTEEEWTNGEKEYLYTGLADSKLFDKYEKASSYADDFYPARPPAERIVFETLIRRESKVPVDDSAVLDQFTKPETREAFINSILTSANSKLILDILKDKAKYIMGINVQYKDKANTTKNIPGLDYDKEITIGSGSTDKEKILNDLTKLEDTLRELDAPIAANSANSHVKLTGISSGNKSKFQFRYNSSDFLLLINSPYWNEVKKINATLFKEIGDLFGIKKENIVVKNFAYWGQSDAKIKFILIHKDALKLVYFVKNLSEVYKAPKNKRIYRKRLEQNFIKQPTKPVYLFKYS